MWPGPDYEITRNQISEVTVFFWLDCGQTKCTERKLQWEDSDTDGPQFSVEENVI